MNKEEFLIEVEKLGVKLSEKQKNQLDEFYQILVEENSKINLTRITSLEDVYLKHFYDSLTLIKEVNLSNDLTLCDVGSGAGFPGIVLKIVFPNLKVTLVDSLQKRVNYLNKTINKLELKNINAIHIRAEDYKDKFDIVTSRAVANLEKLINYCMHLVDENGKFVAMKANISKELDIDDKIFEKNRCKITKINEFLLPKEESKRSLVVIEKLKS